MTTLDYDKNIREFRIEKEDHIARKPVKYFAIHDYYAKKSYQEVDANVEHIRQECYDFKNGRNPVNIAQKIAQAFMTKGLSAQDSYLAVIPASTNDINERRFRKFVAEVCAQTGLKNGFAAITTVDHKPLKGTAGGDKMKDFTFHHDQYRGKRVYLFDDIRTSGTSFTQAAERLLQTGAKEVIGIFLAKTV